VLLREIVLIKLDIVLWELISKTDLNHYYMYLLIKRGRKHKCYKRERVLIKLEIVPSELIFQTDLITTIHTWLYL
jgi:hypothetical protein